MKEILYHDDDVLLIMEYVEEVDDYFLHTKVYNFSPSKAKKMIREFGKILVELSERGITNLKAIPPGPKEEKWQRFFGFVESGIVLGNVKVMELNYGT